MINPPKVDETGKLVKIGDDGLARIDGIVACRRIIRGGIIYIQFLDKDRLRSKCRGTEFVEIPLIKLCEMLSLTVDGNGDWQQEALEA